MADTKGDIVNDAYEEMRISGLTTQPGPEDVRFAVRKLEGMAGMWFKKNTLLTSRILNLDTGKPLF
jgi:hypothetical protein